MKYVSGKHEKILIPAFKMGQDQAVGGDHIMTWKHLVIGFLPNQGIKNKLSKLVIV